MRINPVRLRFLREEAGLAQRDLAQLAQISGSYLSEIEAGRYHPSPPVVARLALALDVSIAELR